jgi:hypothetical protein
MLFIDSNIWCYYFDQRLPEHVNVRDKVREILKSEEIASNTIVIMEVSHYIVRHFIERIARKKIEYFVNLGNMKITDFNRVILNQAIESLLSHGYAESLGGRDATIIATMKLQNITKILSHDNIFKRLAKELEFEVIDPAQPVR